MSISLFGSCRINNVENSNNLNNLLNYTHTTKEVIQLIQFLKGEKEILPPYNKLCFRTPIIFPEKEIYFNLMFNKLFLDTDIFIIEICSKKLYIHNEYYLHHLCVDSRFKEWNVNTPGDILNEFKIVNQTDEEITNDIIYIKNLLMPKKIVIVSHYNSKVNDIPFEERNNLIVLLTKICSDNNILFINPTEALNMFSQNEIMSHDLGHYSDFGLNQFSLFLNNYIKTYITSIHNES
jgi:hypothetical protein